MIPRILTVAGAIALAAIMLGSAAATASSPLSTVAVSGGGAPALSTSPLSSSLSASPSAESQRAMGTNAGLAATVSSDEKSFQLNGRSPSSIHPPNLHQAPSLKSTGGHVTPLYSIAPAPMGVGYYGLNNTTGAIQNTTVNTTSLAGTYSTADPLGTQTEEFDVSTGSSFNDIQPSTDSYGAQLNAVLTNVTIFGKTSFYNPSDPDAPQGCPGYARESHDGPRAVPERVLDAKLH